MPTNPPSAGEKMPFTVFAQVKSSIRQKKQASQINLNNSAA
jgi:hypothetical protein